MNPNWSAELSKAVPNLLVALFTLAGGWFVTQKVTFRLNVRQKQREFFLAATSQFHAAYGEFFAVWKLWNRLEPTDGGYATKRWDLIQRAAKAEAIAESILLKIATEFTMSAKEVEDLGRFRQAFQNLRQSIRDGKHLDWNSSEEPRYREFKRLACHAAILLQQRKDSRPPTLEEAVKNHLEVTSNRWENRWWN